MNYDNISKIVWGESKTEADRQKESRTLRLKYPDSVPIIVVRNPRGNMPELLTGHKYLAPSEISLSQFLYILRKRMADKLRPEETLFLFINNLIPPTSSYMGHLYEDEKYKDGFLYILYDKENAFGN